MQERKIICEITTGSHLYGTNRPESDMDKTGVFLPSRHDLLQIQNCPSEFTKNIKVTDTIRNGLGDVDAKYFSIKRFMQLATEGQPGQLELMFAPYHLWSVKSPEWLTILKNREIFLSQKGVAPFVGFATAQAHKATVKGDNLSLIRQVIAWGTEIHGFRGKAAREKLSVVAPVIWDNTTKQGWMHFGGGLCAKTFVNEQGYPIVEVAGRKYDINLMTKTFLGNMKELQGRYGNRSKEAAEKGYDTKSLMHAYRLLFEAEEFLKTGYITLPLSPEHRELLMMIRNDQLNYTMDEHHRNLTEHIAILKDKIAPRSVLPKEPDWGKVNKLCEQMLWDYLKKEGSWKVKFSSSFKKLWVPIAP